MDRNRASPRAQASWLALWLGLATIVALPSGASAQGAITFNSMPIPGRFADAMAAGPDGSLWYISQAANTVNRVTFPDLHVSTFNVPTAGAGLASITAGPDGKMWFTESAARKIGRVDAGGAFAEFPTPGASPPPQRIFPGPGGTLWATSCAFLQPTFFGCGNFLVMTTAGSSTLLTVNSFSKSFGPAACALGADGNVWCVGTESVQSPFSSTNKLARITPTGGYTSFSPPTALFQGFTIVGAPDGNVWYTWKSQTAFVTGVARITPASVVTEYPIAMGSTKNQIFGLAVGADGNLYFDDRGFSKLYELVLSTATGSGQPTINSGTISIQIPEDLVAVSNQSSSSTGVSAEAIADASCPKGAAFVLRSGGSPPGALEWDPTNTSTECTDLVADADTQRFAVAHDCPVGCPTDTEPEGRATSGSAACIDRKACPDPAGGPCSPNPANDVVLTILLPPGSILDAACCGFPDPSNAFTTCNAQGSGGQMPLILCKVGLIPQGEFRSVLFYGLFQPGLSGVATCTSSTPEKTPLDNSHALSGVFIDPIFSPPVNSPIRRKN